MTFRLLNQAENQISKCWVNFRIVAKPTVDFFFFKNLSRIIRKCNVNTLRMNEMPTLYSRVCFNISSSSRVKFSSTDTARISWNAWWSKTHGFTTSLDMELLWHHNQLRLQTGDKDTEFNLLTSASRDDMNLRTTCLRYSKLISRESLRSAVLVTLVLKVGRFWEDAGGGSGQTLSCLSARISGDFSRASASGSDFSLYNGLKASACTVSDRFFTQKCPRRQKQKWGAEGSHQFFLQRPL